VITFFDTSVFVASFQESHPHHLQSLQALEAMTHAEGVCAAHSFAEFYSVTTRLPPPDRATPAQAGHYLQVITLRVTAIALTVDEYTFALQTACLRQIPGGQIYDFLLLACARKSNAERIVTWNLKHFHSLAPDLAGRIVTP
jgi:predicted nucleic acid-binding protein